MESRRSESARRYRRDGERGTRGAAAGHLFQVRGIMVVAALADLSFYGHFAGPSLAERNTSRHGICSSASRFFISPSSNLESAAEAWTGHCRNRSYARAGEIVIFFRRFQRLHVAGPLETERPRRHKQSL